jgi:hypothetical protein
MPELALELPGGLGCQISRKLAYEGSRLSTLGTGRHYPQELFPLLNSVRG